MNIFKYLPSARNPHKVYILEGFSFIRIETRLANKALLRWVGRGKEGYFQPGGQVDLLEEVTFKQRLE